jgi:hypothetical protein
MPRRIELAKHAILDRLEDISCTKDDQSYRAGEMAALRNAHHALKTLEGIYLNETGGKMIA